MDKKRSYIFGKVYPKDDCFMASPTKTSVTDNIPANVLATLSLEGTPLTEGHPGVDRTVKETPEIVRGNVVKSVLLNGDLWAISSIDETDARNTSILQDIREGKRIGLSLGHECLEGLDSSGHVMSRDFTPDHLAVVRAPRRPGCYVHRFWSENDQFVDSIGPKDVETLISQTESVPGERVTMTIAGDSGENFEMTEFRPVTCDLGSIVKSSETGEIRFEGVDSPPEFNESHLQEKTTLSSESQSEDVIRPINTPDKKTESSELQHESAIEKTVTPKKISARKFLGIFEKKRQNQKLQSYRKIDSTAQGQSRHFPIRYARQEMSTPSATEATGTNGNVVASPSTTGSNASIGTVTPTSVSASQPSSSSTTSAPGQLARNVTAQAFLQKTGGSDYTMTPLKQGENEMKSEKEEALDDRVMDEQIEDIDMDANFVPEKKIRIRDIRGDFEQMDDGERLKLLKTILQENTDLKTRSEKNKSLAAQNRELRARIQQIEKMETDRTKAEEQKLSDEIVARLSTLIGVPQQGSASQTDGQSGQGASRSTLFLKKYGVGTSSQPPIRTGPGGNTVQPQRSLTGQVQSNGVDQASSTTPEQDALEGSKLLASLIQGADMEKKRKLSAFLGSIGVQHAGANMPSQVRQMRTLEVASRDDGYAQHQSNAVKRRRFEADFPYSSPVTAQGERRPNLLEYLDDGYSGKEENTDMSSLHQKSRELAEHIRREQQYQMGRGVTNAAYSAFGKTNETPFQLVDASGKVL